MECLDSHFASAHAEDLTFARLQLERFLEVLDFYRARSLPPPIRHISSSGAMLQLPEAHLETTQAPNHGHRTTVPCGW
jgi:alanine racemase